MSRSSDIPRLPAEYWRLTGATGLNAVGQGALTAAAPLLAATITNDPRLVSGVVAALYLPYLLLSMPAGVLIDRYDHARLISRSQGLQALIVAAIALLAVYDRLSITALAVLTFGLGACRVIVDNGSQTVLPTIVPKSSLHAANGYQQTVSTVGQQFVGPPIGSLLFAVGVALPFGANAVALAFSAVLLATLPRTYRRHDEPLRLSSALGSIKESLSWLARHPLLRTLALLLGVNTFCFYLGNATLVLLATEALGLDEANYGLLLAAAAIGGVIGGLVAAPIIAAAGPRTTLLLSLGMTALLFVGIGLATNAIVLGSLLAASAFATSLWNIVTVSLRQELVPAEMLGRVNSAYRMVGWGLIPLGALVGGFIAHSLGLFAPYLVAGVVRGVVLLLATPVVLRTMR